MTETLTLLSGSEATGMPTGYAVVMANLLPRLNELGWECYHMGWQWFLLPQWFGDDKNRGYTQVCHGDGASGMRNPKFPTDMPKLIKQYKPDVCFSLVDFWFTQSMINYTISADVPYVSYFPIDNDHFNLNWLDWLKLTHTPLGMSKYGVEIIKKHIRKYCKGGWTKHFEMDCLYHGIDETIFQPLKKDQIKEIKEKLFSDNPDMFVVGSIGKNCTRKQYPRMIKAFAEFAKDKSDVILMLKVGDPFNKNGQGYDLLEYLKRFGLEKRNQIRFLDRESNLISGVQHRDLAVLYNLFDVHCLATSGEGFGIPTLEAMACGTPNIIADNTTAPELIGDHGWLVPCSDYSDGEFNAKRELIDVQKLTEAFQDAYDHPKVVKRRGNESFRFSKNFTWDKIAKQLDGILRKACDNNSKEK